VSGTASALPFRPRNATRTNMSGLSSPPGFGSSTRTRTVRVSGFTDGSTNDAFPRNSLPGQASVVTTAGVPTGTLPISVS